MPAILPVEAPTQPGHTSWQNHFYLNLDSCASQLSMSCACVMDMQTGPSNPSAYNHCLLLHWNLILAKAIYCIVVSIGNGRKKIEHVGRDCSLLLVFHWLLMMHPYVNWWNAVLKFYRYLVFYIKISYILNFIFSNKKTVKFKKPILPIFFH